MDSDRKMAMGPVSPPLLSVFKWYVINKRLTGGDPTEHTQQELLVSRA